MARRGAVAPKKRHRGRHGQREEMLFEALEPRTLLSVAGAEILAFEAAIDHLVRPVQSDEADLATGVDSLAPDSEFNPQQAIDVFGDQTSQSVIGRTGWNMPDRGVVPDSPPREGGDEQGSDHVDSVLDLPRLEGDGAGGEGSHGTSDHNDAVMNLPRLEGGPGDSGRGGGHAETLMGLPRLEESTDGAEKLRGHAADLLDLPQLEKAPESPAGFDPAAMLPGFHPESFGDYEAINDLIDESGEFFRHEPARFDFQSESSDGAAEGSGSFSQQRGPQLRYDPAYDAVGPGHLPGLGAGRFELADLGDMRTRFAGEHDGQGLRDLFGVDPSFRSLASGSDTFSPGQVIDAYHQPRAAEPEIGSALGTLPRLEAELDFGPAAIDGQNAAESGEFDDWLSAYDYFDPYADREGLYAEPYRSDGEHIRQDQAPVSPGPGSDHLAAVAEESVDPGRVIDSFHGQPVGEGNEDIGSALRLMPDLEAGAEDHWRPASDDLRRFLRALDPRDEGDDYDTAVDPVRRGER